MATDSELLHFLHRVLKSPKTEESLISVARKLIFLLKYVKIDAYG